MQESDPRPKYAFFESFDALMRGFLRQQRQYQGFRFGQMRALWPLMKEWAEKQDRKRPDQVELRGTMMAEIEQHMECARKILDVPAGEEHQAEEMLEHRVVQTWVLKKGDVERAPFARAVYARCLARLERLDPEYASELGRVYAEQQREMSAGARPQK